MYNLERCDQQKKGIQQSQNADDRQKSTFIQSQHMAEYNAQQCGGDIRNQRIGAGDPDLFDPSLALQQSGDRPVDDYPHREQDDGGGQHIQNVEFPGVIGVEFEVGDLLLKNLGNDPADKQDE